MLRRSEIGVEALHNAAAAAEQVALCVAEPPQRLLGGRVSAATLLGIWRQCFQPLALHRLSEFALDERLDEEREAIDGEVAPRCERGS